MSRPPPIVLTLLLSLAPAARAAEPIARVAGIDVGAEELRAHLATLSGPEQAAIAKDPAALTQVVRAYLARLAVLREARAKQFDETPAARAHLQRVRDEALTDLYLAETSRPPDGYPSEGEVQAAYEGNREAFVTPRQFRLAQVFVLAGRESEAALATKRAAGIARRAREKGADFAALARAESEEQGAAARGGEIGWLTEDQMVPGIRAVVAGLAKDAVSEPVRLEDGWHVVKVLDVRAPAQRPYPEVREAIAAQLRAETSRLRRQAFLAKLLEASPPVVNELALARLLAAEGDTPGRGK